MPYIQDYFAFATKIISVENGNYNEGEFRVREAQGQKEELQTFVEDNQ